MSNSSKTIDFCKILKVANVLIFILLLLVFCTLKDNFYINGVTIFLGCIMCLQTHIFLSAKHSRSSILTLTFLFYIIVYYELRIVTLGVYNHSDVMSRFTYNPNDTNFAIIFIIFCNTAIFFGFYQFEKKAIKSPPEPILWPSVPLQATYLLVLYAAVSIANIAGIIDLATDQSRLARVCLVFVRPGILIFPLLVFFVVFKQALNRKYFLCLAVLYSANAIHSIISGGRGNTIYSIELFMLVLVVNEYFAIKRKYFYKIFYASPFLVVALLVAYNFGTLQRVKHENDSMTKIERIGDNIYGAISYGDLDAKAFNIDRIFSRVGFLDFSSEIIAHEYQYREIFNVTYYYKSIVDNVLTPGFDVYDTPKASLSLILKYQENNNGIPSKLLINNDGYYHSDQFGMYGELYVFFGWFTVLICFVGAYFVGRFFYYNKMTDDRYQVVLKRTIILYLCVRFFNSFGLDWTLAESLPFLIIPFILRVFLKRIVWNT